MAIFEVTIRREGEPVHEVLRPANLPDVLGTGAALVLRFRELQDQLVHRSRPYAGHDAVFVGQIQAGEIYNQAPTECRLQGTRRWVTPSSAAEVQAEFNELLAALAQENDVQIEANFQIQGDAFAIAPADPLVAAFQQAHQAITGYELPLGSKPFVDDGNTFSALAGIPALTHGPAATGAHTLQEQVSIAELVRVAQVYALTAIAYCAV
jgi:acetylornithine deacetylase/succinyl-diaminopimelate desuccinylase-like protein